MTRRGIGRAAEWARRQAAEYSDGADRPLGGYAALMSIYSTATLGAAALSRALGRNAPAQFSPWDVAQLSVATHKVSRLVAKDPVTSPLRAPFTRYTGLTAPGELEEDVRTKHWLGHSVGELLTCPMCLAQWVATAFSAGLVLAPRPTRLALATFSAVAGADFLQHLYVALQQTTDEDD
jgi:hypothetical protein